MAALSAPALKAAVGAAASRYRKSPGAPVKGQLVCTSDSGREFAASIQIIAR